jgi:transcriptional regulator with PAS, ATPase and Fis domain
MVRKVATHNVNVLVLGETGTGKELVARAIHALGPRRHGPFVPIDCAVLPDSLVESELFGHEKGAFTGAAERRIGKFEQAQGGTVFLDEIGNLPAHLQVKLLRVLQERTVERLGGKGPVKVDFRLISATNGTLESQDGDAGFRRDLLHRINGVTIPLPPLRERGDDVHLLAGHFLALFNQEHGRRVAGFSEDALLLLRNHPWPGNVRELANAVKTAVILADDDDLVQPCHLPSLAPPTPAVPMVVGRDLFCLGSISLRNAKRQLTREAETYLIAKALKESNGNKRRAAELLDIDYKSLFNKLNEYGLK